MVLSNPTSNLLIGTIWALSGYSVASANKAVGSTCVAFDNFSHAVTLPWLHHLEQNWWLWLDNAQHQLHCRCAVCHLMPTAVIGFSGALTT